MDFLRQFLRGIVQAWRQLSLSARINIVLAALAVVAVVGMAAFMGARPQYVTLSTGVAADKLQSILDSLTQQDIPYRLEDRNRTVLVPVKNLSAAQLALAEKDLPVGRAVPPGWELFNESELMTNQWLQDVKFMRALQGQIQQQLNAFDFVDYSYVLIREAKEEMFASEQKPSEAAVTLAVTRPLTKQEVKAVVSIVGHAGGPNLHPGNITVTTTSGDVLYLPPESEFASIASSKLEVVEDWERQREMKIKSKLAELGLRGTVSVSAKVNFQDQEVRAEQVSEGTELSTYSTTSNTNSRENLPEGAPGAYANVPEAAAGPGGTSTTEETTEEITNFEPSRTTTTTKIGPGNIDKFLVTMVVEGDYEEAQTAEGQTERRYVGLSDERRKALADLAKAAVGDWENPSEVTLYDQPFDIGRLPEAAAAVEAYAAAQRWDRVLQWGKNGLEILAILGGFLLVRSFLRRAIVRPEEEIEEEEEVKEIPEATREDLRRQEVAAAVRNLAVEEPEMVAALMRSWLAEEEE